MEYPIAAGLIADAKLPAGYRPADHPLEVSYYRLPRASDAQSLTGNSHGLTVSLPDVGFWAAMARIDKPLAGRTGGRSTRVHNKTKAMIPAMTPARCKPSVENYCSPWD
jgi:hypothetical protein